MRVLVTTYPAEGHFHPVAPLALALQRAGHDVRVATDREFGRWVEACGLPVLPAGRAQAELVAATSTLDPEERAVRLFTSVWVPEFARGVLAHLDGWRPDVVVSEEGEHAGPLVAGVLGVPSVTHSWPAPAREPSARAALAGALEDIWRTFGQDGPVRVFGDTYLDCCPPPWQTPDAATIPGLIAVRPTSFDGPALPPPPWLGDLAAPVVLVTLGTVTLFARPDVLRLIVESVAPLAGSVIVATGPLPDTVIAPGPRVHVAAYVPLSTVLPAVDLVVCHGGAGTSTAALLADVPQLVVPQGALSQGRMAAAVARSAVGVVVDEQPLRPAVVTSAARELLGDSRFRERIAAARVAVDARPGPEALAACLVDDLSR